MKARHAVLVALAVAVTLASVAAAGPGTAKQRVAMNVKILNEGTFVLTPLQAGALKPDAGTVTGTWMSVPGRDVMRAGHKITIFNGVTWTLAGKRGTLTIRERNEWVDLGADGNGDGAEDSVAIGTWSVVRGTGAYAGVTGGGGSGHAGLGHQWYARYEGFLTGR